jgi:hypothetical protein
MNEQQAPGAGGHNRGVDAFRVRALPRPWWAPGRYAAVDYLGGGPSSDQPLTRVWAWGRSGAVRRALALIEAEHRSYREDPPATLVIWVDHRPVPGRTLVAETMTALHAPGPDVPLPGQKPTSF